MSESGVYRASLQRWFVALISVFIILFLLAQGRFFLVPLVVSVLLFSLMSAAIDRITRVRIGGVRIPDAAAILITVLLVLGAFYLVFAILYGQIDALIAAGPEYIDRAERLFADLFAWVGEDVASGVFASLRDLDLAEHLPTLAGSVGYLLAMTVLVVLYVGFLFVERPRLPGKIVRLFEHSQRDMRHAVRIYLSIIRSVHRFVLIKALVSVLTGVLSYIALSLFGVDFAATLGTMAVFFNFIPNVGPIAATAVTVLVAAAQFDSLLPVLGVFAVVGFIQFSTGNILEPLVMGRSLHLSPFVIITSLAFWGGIWGIAGMFLAVPIMVVVLIVCSHVQALHPVAVLMSRNGKRVEISAPRVVSRKEARP